MAACVFWADVVARGVARGGDAHSAHANSTPKSDHIPPSTLPPHSHTAAASPAPIPPQTWIVFVIVEGVCVGVFANVMLKNNMSNMSCQVQPTFFGLYETFELENLRALKIPSPCFQAHHERGSFCCLLGRFLTGVGFTHTADPSKRR